MHLSTESLSTIDAIIESHKAMPGPVKTDAPRHPEILGVYSF
jgi:hypothetical protein